jgi:hypothetical protein
MSESFNPFAFLGGLFTSSGGVDPSAANAAGLTDSDPNFIGPPRPTSGPGAWDPTTLGLTNRQWGAATRGLQGLAGSMGQQQQMQQAQQARQMPSMGGGQVHRGNPAALAAFTNNLLQRRAALMPRVPGLLGGRNG